MLKWLDVLRESQALKRFSALQGLMKTGNIMEMLPAGNKGRVFSSLPFLGARILLSELFVSLM